jgi:hypothetical protein
MIMSDQPSHAVRGEGDDRDAAKRAILERHVDHLLGQLYYQVDLIRFHKERADHLQQELERIGNAPVELDEARRKMANLREEIAGRKEVELDLRRRLDSLEREEALKVKHITTLEKTLQRIWARPHNRLARLLKNTARSLLGRKPPRENGRTGLPGG